MEKLYRTRFINHPNGAKFETPLLVPSFSSKGFVMLEEDDKKISESYNYIMVAKEFLWESMLVSAYDLHFDLIPKPEEFNCTEVTFIDSGGYETSKMVDLAGINQSNHDVQSWDEDGLKQTLATWPETMTGIIVNFDRVESNVNLIDQIKSAKELFGSFDQFMGDFLIKPEKNSQKSIRKQIDKIVDSPDLLDDFDIIGVTEKEVGNSQLERMVNIASLRRAMDDHGNYAPIHVFGSLDPINIILYYLAGAEIFDGLTWLKFAYYEGAAIYVQNYSILNSKYGIQSKDTVLRRNFFVDNITYLEKLKNRLSSFANSEDLDYSYFSDLDNSRYNLSELIEKAHKDFLNKIK